jgi:hypothetical protein
MTKQNAFTREDLLRCSRGELFGNCPPRTC